MSLPIKATLTRCRDSQPLVVLNSEPFNGLEIRPAALREMAQRLLTLADMAARMPVAGKRWRPTEVRIDLADRATSAEGQA